MEQNQNCPKCKTRLILDSDNSDVLCCPLCYYTTDEKKIELVFADLTAGESQAQFEILKDFLLRESSNIHCKQIGSGEMTLGSGNLLQIILNSASLGAFASGLSKFLTKEKYKVRFRKSPLGFIDLEIDHPDAANIIKVLKESRLI